MNIRQSLKKRPLLFTSKVGVFDIFFKILCEESGDLGIVIENFKPVPVCPIKWQILLRDYTKVLF